MDHHNSTNPIGIDGIQKWEMDRFVLTTIRIDGLQLGTSPTDRLEYEQQQLRTIISRAAK